MQEVNAAAYKVHPYRNPIIGWLSDVERATAEEQQAYYQRNYRPNNAILSLAGDFDTDRVLDEVVRQFGGIRAGRQSAPVSVSEPEQRGEKRILVRWRSRVPRIAIAYHAPAIAAPDSYALQLLGIILSEGKSSRLYQRLVERDQTVTFVSADYGESKDPTLFHIRAEGRGQHSAEEIEASIYDELRRIISDGITEAELERAKHQIQAHFVLSRERTADQAMLFGQIESLCGLSYIDTYIRRIAAITPAEVSAVCASVLGADNRTVGYLVSDGTVSDDEADDSEEQDTNEGD
jgi:zinc protease